MSEPDRQTNWSWAHEGVDIRDGKLLWYEDLDETPFASGGAVEQTFEHFLANGPWVEGVPANVVTEVTAAVRALSPG